MNNITHFPIYSDYGSSILLVSITIMSQCNIIDTVISDLLFIIYWVHAELPALFAPAVRITSLFKTLLAELQKACNKELIFE